MEWNRVLYLAYGLGINEIVHLITYPGTYDTLYIATEDRRPPHIPRFVKIKQQTSPEHEDVVLPQVIESGTTPLQLWGIGPMAHVYETTQSGHNGDAWSWGHINLYVAATANVPTSNDVYGSRTVVYKGYFDTNWSVEAIFPGSELIDRPIVGFKEKVLIGVKSTIWTNVTGSWVEVAHEIANNREIMTVPSFYALPNVLYAGTWGNHWQDHGAEIWKTYNGLNWVLDYTFDDPNEKGVTSMTEFGGRLYAATDNHNTGVRIWRSDRIPAEPSPIYQWHDVTPTWPNGTSWDRATFLVSYDGKTLYAGTGGPLAVLLASQDGTHWDLDYTISDADSRNYSISSLAWFRDDQNDPHAPPALYAGVTNNSGAQVWRALPPMP